MKDSAGDRVTEKTKRIRPLTAAAPRGTGKGRGRAEAPARKLTPNEISEVRATWKLVEALGADQVGGLFYARLFEVAPDVRQLFPRDLAEQKRKLISMIGLAVRGLDDFATLRPALEALGLRHVVYGTKPWHYAAVGDVLIWTLSEGLRARFTPFARRAWVATYQVLADTMMDAAETKRT